MGILDCKVIEPSCFACDATVLLVTFPPPRPLVAYSPAVVGRSSPQDYHHHPSRRYFLLIFAQRLRIGYVGINTYLTRNTSSLPCLGGSSWTVGTILPRRIHFILHRWLISRARHIGFWHVTVPLNCNWTSKTTRSNTCSGGLAPTNW